MRAGPESVYGFKRKLGSVWRLAGLGVGDIFMKTGQSWGQGATQAAGMSPVMRHRVLRMWRWADKGNTMR